MRRLFTFLFAILIAPVVSLAQPLADRVPGDAEIYFAWSGVDSIGPGYDQSHLKAILDASQLPQFFHDAVPRLLNRVGAEDPMAANRLRQVIDIVTPLVVHPSAFYFGGLDAPAPGGPPLPKVALICDAGADAQQIAQRVSRLLQQAQGSPFDCRAVGTLVVVSDFVFPEHTDTPLSQNKDFQAAMAQVGKDPAAVVYVDGTALVATINNAVGQFAPPEVQQMWPQVRDALGIGGLKAVAATAGLDGKNWAIDAMIAAPAPRKGLLAMLDSEALAPELLKLLPVSSSAAGACSFDVNGLFTQVDQAIIQFSPDKGEQFHQGVAQLNSALGLDIQKDFLAVLGSQWGYYVDPATAGNGMLGFTIVNRARNADQLQTSLTSLETLANNIIKQQLRGSQPRVTVQFRQVTSGGTPIHYLATPLVAPSWAIKDGSLYIGLYPQIVASAVNRPADAKSILDNPDFQAVAQKLHAPPQFMSFGYADLPRMMPNGYQTALAMTQTYFGIADLLGMQTPAMILPSLEKIMAETEPAGAVGWTDDAGYHFKSIQPFPGSAMLASGSSVVVGESALMTSIMLPSLNRARETANRVKCASNLRQIGQGIMLYSNDNKGAYPPDLGTLVKSESISVGVFICPDSNTEAPSGLTPEQTVDWVNNNSSYVYVGAGLKQQNVDPMTVVCYEKDENHGGDGMNLLFADGHVEFQNREMAQHSINNIVKPPQ